QRFPGGFEHAVTQVLGTERRSLRCGEHKVFRLHPTARSPMNFEQSHKRCAHRNNTFAASRFRRPKPVRIGFLDRERLTEKINTPPTEREDFADPESREHSDEHNRTARIRQSSGKALHMLRGKIRALLHWFLVSDATAASGIVF